MTHGEVIELLDEFLIKLYQEEGIGASQYFNWYNKLVRGIHKDGTLFSFKNAALITVNEDWWGVIAEHYGTHAFHKLDVYDIAMYERKESFEFSNMKNTFKI